MRPLGAAFLVALQTIAAVIVAFGITYALCVRAGSGPAPAILAAALCVGLMRRPQPFAWLSIARKLLTLPLVALGAGLVGLAFLRLPWLGALLFVGGITLSVALRNFGERGVTIGRTIAMPLLTMLIVPVAVDSHAGLAIATLLVVAAGVFAILSATAVTFVARIGGEEQAARPERTRPNGTMSVSTRMALQMLVALALAFVTGMLAFPAHWPWIVLSAFIVCSGAIGRGDAVYKALLRLAGAIAGTFVAALVAHVSLPNPAAYAAAILFVLFVGIWLRQINYAYWAACATLIFALLQGTPAADPTALFGLRVLCIFIGALCGVAAVWFVYPIRTEQVVRRRVADALGAMRAALDGTRLDAEYHAAQLDRVAPPVRLHRAVFGAKDPDEHPAGWIDRTRALLERMSEADFDRAAAGAELRRLRDSIAKPAEN